MTLDAAKATAKERLSPKRYHHTKQVVKAAQQLALRFGADAEKARLAAWLHDILKGWGREELLQMLRRDAIMAGCTTRRPLPVWHGPAAAVYARQCLGVQDAEVLSAIDCHTTGKPGMSKLDKVVFLADYISEDRTMPGVEAVRRLAKTDLDAAVTLALEQSVGYLQRMGQPVDKVSLAALEELRGGQT